LYYALAREISYPISFLFCLNQNKTGLQMDSKEKIILGYQKAF